MNQSASLIDAIAAETDVALAAESFRRVPGGDINTTLTVADRAGRSWFLKVNRAERLSMFEAETAGLSELAASGAVRVPVPAGCGTANGQAWLLMECLDLSGDRNAAAGRLGRELALMHRHTAGTFGWSRGNTIGNTPQNNTQDDDWIRFFAQRRLGFQLRMAAENGFGDLLEPGLKLTESMDDFFDGYAPAPSLLHGDLWGGNWGASAAGEPVIFDPAVYYGDREADLAMTRLFGGFPESFYSAYTDSWPLEPGHPTRTRLYNLYHVLNHLNLFGSGYLGQARSMIESLLAELGAGR